MEEARIWAGEGLRLGMARAICALDHFHDDRLALDHGLLHALSFHRSAWKNRLRHGNHALRSLAFRLRVSRGDPDPSCLDVYRQSMVALGPVHPHDQKTSEGPGRDGPVLRIHELVSDSPHRS